MAIDKIQSESINLADNFAFTGTVTGAGATNKPSFFAKKNSNTNISNNTWTVVNFDTEIVDTNSAYDTSSYRFTVPSDQAGKYYIFNTVQAGGSATRSIIEILSQIRVSGTDKTYAHASFYNTATAHQLDLSNNCILDLSVGEYVDVRCYVNVSSGTPNLQGNSSTLRSFFGGYKLF
ncbi:hypothetical protein N9S53_00440 [Candidatus Pelagibacter sp.]|nr:hypothetical protein [Candidatus Pelagibacter sp.]